VRGFGFGLNDRRRAIVLERHRDALLRDDKRAWRREFAIRFATLTDDELSASLERNRATFVGWPAGEPLAIRSRAKAWAGERELERRGLT